ncbi:MAG: hypothetical protein CMJ31_08575 [Phycisphaerae bacterium]|nr:hypothetical protein [Phycisphaerae bacterium]
MSREQRLALVAGFAVFLVVAVLISDHLSRARDAEIADGSMIDASLPTRPLEPTPDRIASAGPHGAAAADSSVRALIDSLPASAAEVVPGGSLASTPSLATRPIEPVIASEDRDIRTIPVDDVVEIAIGPALTTNENRVSSPTDNQGPVSPTLQKLRELAAEHGVPLRAVPEFSNPISLSAPSQVDERRSDTRRPIDSSSSKPRPAYHVREGDTLIGIAQTCLGDGDRYREIEELNPDRIGKDGLLRLGVRLLLPHDAELPRSTVTRERTSPTPAVPSSSRKYVVKKGDTLGGIAQREVGSVRFMKRIIELNEGVIKDANDIRVGMELTLPAKS